MYNKIKLLAFLLSFLLWFWTFVSAETLSLWESIEQKKINIEQTFDSSYESVFQKFQESIAQNLSTPNYQWLLCLWVIDDTALLGNIQKDYKNLKLSFLNSYAKLLTDLSDIEQKNIIQEKTSVSLFASWTTYESEIERISSAFDTLFDHNTTLANNFKETYITKINQFINDVDVYSKNNVLLLTNVTNRIKDIQDLQDIYDDLISNLVTYQTQLAGSWSLFFSKLYSIKQASISGLSNYFQYLIDKQTKRNRVLPNLWSELEQQKQYALWLFSMQFDENVNLLLEKWYDNKEFTQIKKDVDAIISTYKNNWKFSCTSLLWSSYFEQDIALLKQKILSFDKTFSSQLSWTIDSSLFQENIMHWISLVVKAQKDIQKTFIEVMNQKTRSMLNELRKQKTQEISPSQDVPVSLIPSNFSFTKAFRKWVTDPDIKILQELLKKMNFYDWPIDSIYTSTTIDAVYQYQLSKNLLRWYENKPETWWWMWPATRASLNKDLLK